MAVTDSPHVWVTIDVGDFWNQELGSNWHAHFQGWNVEDATGFPPRGRAAGSEHLQMSCLTTARARRTYGHKIV